MKPVAEMSIDATEQQERFAAVERVVADPLRFKLRLGIGEAAYASLRVKKKLQDLWDVGGMAATGAAVASSSVVASTFFASGGLLSLIGLGTAVTPVSWVVAAAFVSGSAYYGVTRLFRSFSGTRVDTIPKFINTPIDLLAASLFDLMAALAVRVAAIDGVIAEEEKDVIVRHFIEDWGLDQAYVEQAMTVIVDGIEAAGVKDLARALASFQIDNPDCNPAAMQSELMQLLANVIATDGVSDEREELALEAIERVFREEIEFSFSKAGRNLAQWSRGTASTLQSTAQRILSRPNAAEG